MTMEYQAMKTEQTTTKPTADADAGGRVQALVSGCNCEYQHAKPWGYQLWKRVDEGGEYWETMGRGSLSQIQKAVMKIDRPVLVKCRGCGCEMLREYR